MPACTRHSADGPDQTKTKNTLRMHGIRARNLLFRVVPSLRHEHDALTHVQVRLETVHSIQRRWSEQAGGGNM